MLKSVTEINELVKQLQEYDNAYNEGKPLISDLEYDILYFELMKLENETGIYLANSPTQCINYSVVNELNKKAHNHAMLSLDKTKDWNEFIQYFGSHSVIGMTKLDGLTCSLQYQDGRLVGAETRGNGVVGEDILHNALVVANIPNRISYTGELTLDGEIISTYTNFENFKNEYANPRNFAAGSIRLLDSAECAKRGLKFIAWNLVSGGSNSHIENLNFLQELGFTVTPWTSSFDWDAKEFLIAEAERLGYPIDGLVGKFNDIAYGNSLGATSHHSRDAYAFKFADETATTHLTGIEWTMGRTGVLTPVAVFNPIELEGTTVERANLHNISVMKELLHGAGWEGQKVQVFKANMIIPQIQSAEKDNHKTKKYFNIPMVCPMCGKPTKQITEIDSTVLMCSNDACSGKLINRLDHFCGKKGLDIKGLSKATLEKLIDWKWVEEERDIFELYQYELAWIKKPGFGKKSVAKILDAIDYARIGCELHQFISALGIPLIGITASKDLADYFKTWEAFVEAAEGNFNFYDLPNFGMEMHCSLKNFNYKSAKYMFYNYVHISKTKDKEKKVALNNMVFCITGTVNQWKNRDELKSFIENNGGKVTSSVSKNTNYLINNNVDSTSSKNMTAKKLGVPIITEEQFLSLMDTFN